MRESATIPASTAVLAGGAKQRVSNRCVSLARSPPSPTAVRALRQTNAYGGTLGNIFAAVFAMGEGYASIKKMASLLNAETKRQQLKKARAVLRFVFVLLTPGPSGAWCRSCCSLLGSR